MALIAIVAYLFIDLSALPELPAELFYSAMLVIFVMAIIRGKRAGHRDTEDLQD